MYKRQHFNGNLTYNKLTGDPQQLIEATTGISIVEIPEGVGKSKGVRDAIKKFTSTTSDISRLVYRHTAERFLRRFVCIETTNYYEAIETSTLRRDYLLRTRATDRDKIDNKLLRQLVILYFSLRKPVLQEQVKAIKNKEQDAYNIEDEVSKLLHIPDPIYVDDSREQRYANSTDTKELLDEILKNRKGYIYRPHLKTYLKDRLGNYFYKEDDLSLIHISEPTRLRRISYAVFCLKK